MKGRGMNVIVCAAKQYGFSDFRQNFCDVAPEN